MNDAVLHNSQNNFDATVYKNDETIHVLITLLGSWEAPKFIDLLPKDKKKSPRGRL
ncbi:hypothetical protein AAHB49_16430 [Bacillus cereus]